ncbi:MAG: hypothetical protein ACYDGN_09130 [Acidimicrobiales bacterium]
MLSAARVMLTGPATRGLWKRDPEIADPSGPPRWLVALTFWLTRPYPSAAAIERDLCHPIMWGQLAGVARRYGSGSVDWLPPHRVDFGQLSREALSTPEMVDVCRTVSRLLRSQSGLCAASQGRVGERASPDRGVDAEPDGVLCRVNLFLYDRRLGGGMPPSIIHTRSSAVMTESPLAAPGKRRSSSGPDDTTKAGQRSQAVCDFVTRRVGRPAHHRPPALGVVPAGEGT